MKPVLTIGKSLGAILASIALVSAAHGVTKPVAKQHNPIVPAKTVTQSKPVAPAAKPSNNRFLATEDFRWGYIDKSGKMALSGFERVGNFSDGLALVRVDGLYGYIDTTGKIVIPATCTGGGLFADGLAPVRVGRLWGFVDKTGTLAIKAQYTDAFEFSEGLAVVQVGDKYGAIDTSGAMTIQPNYDQMGQCSEGLISIKQDGKWGFIDKTGTTIINPQFDRVDCFSEGLAPAWTGGECGFIDKTGQWVIEPKYAEAQSFSEGLAPVGITKRDVVKKDGRVVAMKTFVMWGYIDKSGNKVIPLELLNVGRFSEGLAFAWKDKVFGYIDKTGNMVLPSIYDNHTGSFHNGLARTEIGSRSGFIDETGKVVIPETFTSADNFSEGLAAVTTTTDGHYGFVDPSGNMVIQPQFEHVFGFKNGFARVMQDWKWGLADKTGNVVVTPQFGEIAWYNGKIVVASIKGLWGVFDWSGQPILEPQFNSVSCLGDKLIIVEKDKKYGVVDATGNLVVAPQFDDCGWLYAEGLLAVKSGDKFGFIDEAGKSVIEPAYDEVGGFTSEGLCSVRVGDKWGFIDKTGKMVIAPDYELATSFAENYAAVKSGGIWGFIDKTGNFLLKPQFADASYFSGGLAPVQASGKWGYIDKTGKLTIPAKFDKPGSFENGLAKVRMGEQTGYIDRTGKMVWDARVYPSTYGKAALSAKSTVTIDDSGVRIVKVKVVADQNLQKSNRNWAETLKNRMQAVSDLLEKNVKVRLSVVETGSWESPELKEGEDAKTYQSSLNASLDTDIEAGDAELVIGFAGNASGSEVLAFTHYYCNRIIVFDPYRADPEKEKELTETVAHEVCHTFGVFHVADERSIMCPTTVEGVDQSFFDPFAVRQVDVMRDYDFAKGVYSISNEKAEQTASIFSEGHIPHESCPIAGGHATLGDIFKWLGDLPAAINEYQVAVGLDGTEPARNDVCRLGEALVSDGQLIPGVMTLEKCRNLEANSEVSAFWHADLGDDFQGILDSDSGIKSCQQTIDPKLAEIYERCIRAHVDPQEALAEYREAVKADPKKAVYHSKLAETLLTFGLDNEALSEYQKAVEIEPDNVYYRSRVDGIKADIDARK